VQETNLPPPPKEKINERMKNVLHCKLIEARDRISKLDAIDKLKRVVEKQLQELKLSRNIICISLFLNSICPVLYELQDSFTFIENCIEEKLSMVSFV
jgi:hypothetical protein